MSEKLPVSETALANEDDPRELKRVAIQFAASSDAQDHRVLREHLDRQSFLDRLDPSGSQATAARNLRLARVIKTLADNPAPSAHGVLVDLTGGTNFLQAPLRTELLIRALRWVRPSPPQAITFLDRTSPPGGSLAYDVVETLAFNQSEPAMALFEAKLNHPDHSAAAPEWLHYAVLPRRDDVPLLKVLERVVSTNAPDSLKVDIVDVLFSYRPQKWYLECGPPKPPERLAASREAKEILRRIGRHALVMLSLPAETLTDVRAGLAVLGEPETRENGTPG